MQEIRYSFAEEMLTRNVTPEQIDAALANPDNRTVAIHRPGAVFDSWEKGKRKRFRVEPDGSIQRITLSGADWHWEAASGAPGEPQP